MADLVPDLAQFVQRRELMSYEQRAARMAYAYGVDLRRSAWLDHSTLGEPIMRAVDRRWNGFIQDLQGEVLEPPSRSAPTVLLEELARLLRLLRAPLPTLRRLRPSVPRDDWAPITPLGTTLGGTHFLILDVERLMDMPAHERTFLLGSGLGNLQCDHGSIFAAHLMSHRARRGFGIVRTLLRPWSRVAPFSSDRAGLLALGELESTLDALRTHADPGVSWWPPLPALSLRETALQDFDKSRVMTRLRLTYTSHRDWTVTPPGDPTHPQPTAQTAQVDTAPVSANGPSPSQPPTRGAVRATGELSDDDRTRRMRASVAGSFDAPHDQQPATHGDEPVWDVVEEAELEAEAIQAERERTGGEDAELDEQAVAERLRQAWPLARVDARLTRRLGLL